MIAYLTIDDAPSADWHRKLHVLRRLRIPAVFFCWGEHLEARPAFAAAALADGHVLGNHSWSHPSFSEISLDSCRHEIERTHELLEQLHAEAGRRFAPRYFRFPYGDKGALTGSDTEADLTAEGAARKAAIQRALRDHGYAQPAFPGITYRWYHDRGLLDDADWYWTYDCMEWSIHSEEPLFGVRSAEDVFSRMEENEPEGGRGL
ncbi:MAG: polysaccharide deacetylase family protein, partial [Spirochaetota bacterium]